MSKKDYELIARVLRAERAAVDAAPALESERESVRTVLNDVAREFADALAATNPRFNRGRFIAACVGEDATDSAGRKVRYSTFGPNDVAR